MTSTIAAIVLIALAQTPSSNGENANQIRASIYEIATANQSGALRVGAPERAARPAVRARPARIRR